jgi:polysaccharide pyruvyl transferase WcaK-like protein
LKDQNLDTVIAYSDGRAVDLVSKSNAQTKIAWVHTDIFSRFNKGVASPQILKEKYLNFSTIITVSEFLRQKVQEIVPRGTEVKTVYTPIPVEDIISKSSDYSANLPSGSILAVGRLSYEKGFERLIESYAELNDSFQSQHPLYIIGDGPDLDRLTDLILKYQLSGRIHLLGEKQNPYPFIKAASLLVVPSIFEGLGLVAIEAQILGTPVLATETGGLIEVLDNGQSGYLTKIEDLSQAIRNFFSEANDPLKKIDHARSRLNRFTTSETDSFFNSLTKPTLTLYANGPLGNHGCEALYYSISMLCPVHEIMTLDEQDIDSPLWENIDVQRRTIPTTNICRFSLPWFRLLLNTRIFKRKQNKDYLYYLEYYKKLKGSIKPCQVYASIGGDNYCYKSSEWLYALNTIIRNKGGKTILLGCSISPEDLSPTMIKDLSSFDLIIARESITASALRKHGLSQVKLVPDPAFLLPSDSSFPLPQAFIPNNTIGINISPVILSNEQTPGIIRRNIHKLIRFILDETDMNIAFIPHVELPNNSDLVILKELYAEFESSGRVCLFEDHNAKVLKGIIGQCRFLIAARTHASIAAYSQGIPTLVIGYSVKAEGIAYDLFGSNEHFVCDVRKISQNWEILHSFQWIMNNEGSIKSHLSRKLVSYTQPLVHLADTISSLLHHE